MISTPPPETLPPSGDAMTHAFAALGTWDVAHSAIGVISTANPIPRTGGESQRVFALASVTKMLTATAILVAVEEGSLHLDQPAGPPGSTIAHLLAHASGLGPDGRRLTAPGTRRIYSNWGFDVLGSSLAEATDMPFDTYLQEAVFEPLGMTHTRLIGSPASGAESTVSDLVRLAGAWLDPGKILSAATVSDASRPWFGELTGVLPGFGPQDPNPWGLGVEIRGSKSPHWTGTANSPATFGHFGQSGTFLWIDPRAGTALVVLTDRAFGPWAALLWPVVSDLVLAA